MIHVTTDDGRHYSGKDARAVLTAMFKDSRGFTRDEDLAAYLAGYAATALINKVELHTDTPEGFLADCLKAGYMTKTTEVINGQES